jgi:hypothetical protein
MVHIGRVLLMLRRACDRLHPPVRKKGDFKTSLKQNMLSIYCRAILFTIEVVGNLPLVVRKPAFAARRLRVACQTRIYPAWQGRPGHPPQSCGAPA